MTVLDLIEILEEMDANLEVMYKVTSNSDGLITFASIEDVSEITTHENNESFVLLETRFKQSNLN